MIFNFQCADGHITQIDIKFGEKPPENMPCCKPSCSHRAERVWEAPHISVAPDDFTVAASAAVSRNGRAVTKEEAVRKEKAYARDIQKKRQLYKDQKNVKGWKPSHSIPPEAYYGKVRETGDLNYWKDSKNLNRAKQFKVT
jgi:hypothetical protein